MASGYIIESPIVSQDLTGSQAEILMVSGSNYIRLVTPSTLSSNVDFALPGSTGSTGQVLRRTATGANWQPSHEMWIIEEQQPSGTNGGSSTAGTWQTRVLNTLTKDTGVSTDVQLNVSPAVTNQLLIQDGTYYICGCAPSNRGGPHQSRLRNITDGTSDVVGNSACVAAVGNNDIVTTSDIIGIFTVSSGPKVFEFQHQTTNSQATDGLGIASGFGEVEIYSRISITKM
jgi:hypothetical protein